jgi:hypothetical protein
MDSFSGNPINSLIGPLYEIDFMTAAPADRRFLAACSAGGGTLSNLNNRPPRPVASSLRERGYGRATLCSPRFLREHLVGSNRYAWPKTRLLRHHHAKCRTWRSGRRRRRKVIGNCTLRAARPLRHLFSTAWTILHSCRFSCLIGRFRGFFVEPRAGVDEENRGKESERGKPALGVGHDASCSRDTSPARPGA